MEIAYLLVTLLCPLSMVAMVAWWSWATHTPKDRSSAARTRTAADAGEITRLRAQLDQLEAHSRDQSPRGLLGRRGLRPGPWWDASQGVRRRAGTVADTESVGSPPTYRLR